jgi:hypothetical protein
MTKNIAGKISFYRNIALSFYRNIARQNRSSDEGLRYIYIYGTEQMVRGMKGKSGFHAAKSRMALVLGFYGFNLEPPQAGLVVENMADYLSRNKA